MKNIYIILRDISNYYGFKFAIFDKSVIIIENKIMKVNEEYKSEVLNMLHTSPQRYEISKSYFIKNCADMKDYLRSYNLNDCWLLQKSIKAYSSGFLNDFGVNVHKFMSLPGLAQHVAFKFYDKTAAPIYSFGRSSQDYNKEIRKNLDGGLCMLFHRMMVVGEQNYTRENCAPLPEAAIKAPNEEVFQRISSFDFNSVSEQQNYTIPPN